MEIFIDTVKRQFLYYKSLGEKTFSQVADNELFKLFSEDGNSIAGVVKHLHGNMLSRWTDFLDSDGEKEWRDREAEFVNDILSREEMMRLWHEGWDCLFSALDNLSDSDLEKTVYIRNQGHTVQDAIIRQLAHYPYHIGQIVFMGKSFAGQNWQSLSIPKGESQKYNSEKFDQKKTIVHFTDEFLKPPVDE